MKKTNTKKTYIRMVCTLAFLLFGFLPPAVAQISYMAPSDIKAEMKQSKRDAKKYEADHKETHLDMSATPVKPGETGRKTKKIKEKRTDYLYDGEIDSLDDSKQPKEKPKKSLFFRKKTKD